MIKLKPKQLALYLFVSVSVCVSSAFVCVCVCVCVCVRARARARISGTACEFNQCKVGRAVVRTIPIRHSHNTSLRPSPLHDEPSQKF